MSPGSPSLCRNSWQPFCWIRGTTWQRLSLPTADRRCQSLSNGDDGCWHVLTNCNWFSVVQGSDTRVRTQKNQVGFSWVHPPKKTHRKKNPHFYFNLILVYTLYATNNAIFYCFKAFMALSYWVFVLFYLFFPACPKNPIKPKKPPKPTGLGF